MDPVPIWVYRWYCPALEREVELERRQHQPRETWWQSAIDSPSPVLSLSLFLDKENLIAALTEFDSLQKMCPQVAYGLQHLIID